MIMSTTKINYYPSNKILEMNRLGITPDFYELLELFKAIPKQKRADALELLMEYHKLPDKG